MSDDKDLVDERSWDELRPQLFESITQSVRRESMEMIKEKTDFEAAYSEGEEGAVLWALANSALTGEKIPEWAAKAYLDKFFKVTSAGAESWDEVFGNPHPPRTNFAAIQKWGRLAWPVFTGVEKLRAKGVPINEALQQVAEENLISPSTARDYYYRFRRENLAPDVDYKCMFTK